MYELGTKRIQIDGTEVVPFPLYVVLDGAGSGPFQLCGCAGTGKNPTDYLQRVEPSPSGGRKMAAALMQAILGEPLESGRAEQHEPFGEEESLHAE